LQSGFFTSQEAVPEAVHPEVADSPFFPRWLLLGGAVLHYVDEGRGTPPVLMVHGNPTWSFLYRGVVSRLRESFRCIVPDLPGYGYSLPPPGYGFSPQEHAAWLRTLLRELGVEQFILVAQDWGGPIGLSLAVEHPEQVKGLVLANTWCWPPFWDARLFSLFMGGPMGRWLNIRHNVFPRFILPLGMSRKRRGSSLQAYVRPFLSPEARQGVPVLAEHLRRSSDWLARLEQRLPRLRGLPIHLVWGVRDPIFGRSAYLDKWMNLFPEAYRDRVLKASHYLPEDAPERMARAVRAVDSASRYEARS